MTTLARTLGDFAAGFAAQDLPGLAFGRAKMSLASDTAACDVSNMSSIAHIGTITTAGSTIRATCKAPRGASGIDWADLDVKHHHLAPVAGLRHTQVEDSLAMIHCFEALASPAMLRLVPCA